jgi:hypothetical protein
MGSEAMLKAEDGSMLGHGLSVLDIVKHAIKTIIRNLGDKDRVALIAYSNAASSIAALTVCNDAGRRSLEQSLNSLDPAGMTNLWDGLKVGLEQLKNDPQPGRLQHMMLFTDGLPNINPPRGILPMLKRLKDKEGGKLPCTINTFGFGYELDSELLSQLANDGSGAYNFIPDAGFVGTVFVNAMANLLVSSGFNATLTLKPQGGASIVEVVGGPTMVDEDGGKTITLGLLQFGQSKDLVVHMNGYSSDCLKATVHYSTRAGPTPMMAESNRCMMPNAQSVERQRCRLRTVDTIREAMKILKLTTRDKAAGKELPFAEAQGFIHQLIQELKTSPVAGLEEIQYLLEDIEGQVTESLSREDWYTKWGQHYLPSLMSAHLIQQCNNFKDAGVQAYGGALFQTIRDQADDIFLTLPAPEPKVAPAPPVPSPMAASLSRPIAVAVAPSMPISMAAFHDRFSGCVDGSCLVRMACGRMQPLVNVRKGDAVATRSGGAGIVECAVWTRLASQEMPLVELSDGLRLTPYHPVLSHGEWKFPASLAPIQIRHCDVICTLMLEEGVDSIEVDGTHCIVLGHGVTTGVAKHPFYGSRHRVLEALSKLRGFSSGLVEVAPEALRDPITGLVCGFTH